jgi:hypothetical protein
MHTILVQRAMFPRLMKFESSVRGEVAQAHVRMASPPALDIQLSHVLANIANGPGSRPPHCCIVRRCPTMIHRSKPRARWLLNYSV